jgi:hypothetical protein
MTASGRPATDWLLQIIQGNESAGIRQITIV